MLCLDANNLVLLLNDLEAREFAFRRRDPTDRRRHLVEITEEGRRAFENAEKGIESVEDEVLSLLSRRRAGRAAGPAGQGARLTGSGSPA